METLTVRGPMFHSPGDETAFFTWLRRIRAVQDVKSRGAELTVHLRPGKITADEAREFRALFHRYGLDTSELQGIETRR